MKYLKSPAMLKNCCSAIYDQTAPKLFSLVVNSVMSTSIKNMFGLCGQFFLEYLTCLSQQCVTFGICLDPVKLPLTLFSTNLKNLTSVILGGPRTLHILCFISNAYKQRFFNWLNFWKNISNNQLISKMF